MANDIRNMKKANKNKADEFYTQLSDIEKEVKNYKEYFKDKIVLCNCDDPYESNFFKYFAMNFNYLGLKKLICTCYDDSPITGKEISLSDLNYEIPNVSSKKAYKIIINEVNDQNNDGAINLLDVEYLIKNEKNTLSLLKGDGDFRSEECIELLKEADIVVTNPPFSLFREYVEQLITYKKLFLIIGNQNAITYKEIFPLLKDNKMWLGISMDGSNRYFRVPDYYQLTEKTGKVENGVKYAFVKGVRWFTNMDNKFRREKLILYQSYTPEKYPNYDNYDAINVDKVTDIPKDYKGVMGVPITFLGKYNPSQFKILGLTTSGSNAYGMKQSKLYINAKQHNIDGTVKTGNKVNDGPTILHKIKPNKVYYTADNADGYLEILYARLLIQNIGVEKDGN